MAAEAGLSAEATLTAVALVASLGVVVLALEDLSTTQHFRSDGLMSWETRRDAGALGHGQAARALDQMFTFPRFRLFVAVRLAAACLAAVGAAVGALLSVPILVVFLSLVAMSVRSPYGLDGAHQMYIVVFGALSLAGLAPSTWAIPVVALFVGAQSVLAYFVSGASKLVSPVWRSGNAVVGVMATSSYGHPWVFAVLSAHPRLALCASWSVIVLECGFPVVLLGGIPLLTVMAAGVLFHLANSIIMGLNGFLFAFLATYPAIAYSAAVIN